MKRQKCVVRKLWNLRKHSNKVNEVKQIRSCYDGDTKSNSRIYIYRLYEKDNQCARYICKKATKENFYHGILLGLLGYKSTWRTMSNAESGTGYSDILVEVGENRTGIAIELKYAEGGDMDAACAEALQQIEEKDYIARLKQDGMQNFIKYGIACFKKNCKVTMGD